MPRPRPSGPPQGQGGMASPNTFQANAPQKFQNIQGNITQGIGKVQNQVQNMANRHFGSSSPYAHLTPQLSHPYGQGGTKPRNVHGSTDGFQTVDPTTQEGEVGPQALGTYAPDINDSQFQNENFGKKGLRGSNQPLGYGNFGGMGSMMGMGMMGGMGGMDPMMAMFLQMLMGGGGMGGPQVGR